MLVAVARLLRRLGRLRGGHRARPTLVVQDAAVPTASSTKVGGSALRFFFFAARDAMDRPRGPLRERTFEVQLAAADDVLVLAHRAARHPHPRL